MLQKELLTKTNYAAIGEEITHELAGDFVKAYEATAQPKEARGYVLGRNIIDKILAQPGCVGMRFYYGLNEDGQKTLVYVGIDSDGQDITKHTVVMNSGEISTSDATIADRLQVFYW